MELSEILSILTTGLLAALAWYYKRDADNNATVIKSLVSGMDELKALMRVHTTNYEHLLREVQSVSNDCKTNSRDIAANEKAANEKAAELRLDLEKIKFRVESLEKCNPTIQQKNN